jgi:hypothetical protein
MVVLKMKTEEDIREQLKFKKHVNKECYNVKKNDEFLNGQIKYLKIRSMGKKYYH